MEKLYKIGELAKACNTTLKTIRYYEEKELIKADKIDKFNNYHYYSFETLVNLQKILRLKELGFSLEEIKNYNKQSNKEKIEQLNTLLKTTNEKIEKLSSLEYSNIHHLPYFINDEDALGLWKAVAFAGSIEDYKNGKFHDGVNNLFFKHLYFLNNGKGFGRVVDWSKGVVNIGLKNTLTYTIEKNKLYLDNSYPIKNNYNDIIIFERIDNIKRDFADPIYEDDINIPYLKDENVIGLWEIYDVVAKNLKNKYSPNNPKEDMKYCFYQSITFKSDGSCIKEQNCEFIKQKYTKGKIINKKQKITEDYQIIKDNENTYLLVDTKNEDYLYNNSFDWVYVFKKV